MSSETKGAEEPKGKYGTGTVYKPGDRQVWWVQWWDDGKRYTESSHSTDRRVAVRLLREKLKELGRGRPVAGDARRATFDELVEGLRSSYRLKGNRSLDRALRAVAHLRPAFGRTPPHRIDYPMVEKYINARLDSGASHSTVKTERATLHRMLKLWAARGRLPMPTFPEMGDPDNAREVYFEPGEFAALHAQLAPHVQPVAEFLYLSGWRTREALGLQWGAVNLAAGEVRLAAAGDKEKRPRLLAFTELPQLGDLLRRQYAATMALERETGQKVDHVFHRRGKPLRSFRTAWANALKRAGLSDRHPHDFRRTAVRRLERAGVPRSQAKRMVGHRTDSIYERYASVARSDLHEAGAKVTAQLEADDRAARQKKTATEPLRSADGSDDASA